MSFRRRQLSGWTIISVSVLLGLAWLWHLDLRQKISTNVLDLVPAGEQSPELNLVRSMAGEAEAKTMLFSLHGADGGPAPAAAAIAFAAGLARESAFVQAVALNDPASRDALGRAIFSRRLTLLFPIWLAERERAYATLPEPRKPLTEWLAEDSAAALGQFLATPAALAFQDLVPSDPLLLVPGVVDRVKPALSYAQPAGANAALVWARLASSPLSEQGQQPAFAAIQRAEQALQASFPGTVVTYTGVNRFAAASRARIEQEVSRLNLLSLAAVFTVAFVFIRGVHRALHLVPVVLVSILGAWVFATLVFTQVHVLVFVVGSLLTGVAIDYGFYLYMQPPAAPQEDYWQKVRRLAKPLLASCFTTVAGFALLLFSELPLIRQLGVFVGAGLLCALGTAVIYFSTVRNAFLPARSFRGGAALPAHLRRWLRWMLMAGWVVALVGLVRLSWRDDIRDLEIPSPELKRTDARIRSEFGEHDHTTVYVTYGDTLAAARERLQALDGWLGAQHAPYANFGAVIPTPSAYSAALDFTRTHPDFPNALRRALNTAGYDADAFAPFFDAYATYAKTGSAASLDEAVAELRSQVTGPLGLLLHTEGSMKWFVTIVTQSMASAPPAALQTVARNQLETLNGVFGRYRQSALWLSAAGLAIVGTGVLLTYGVRDGVRIFAIPCGACLGVFGVFGWLGQPLNLFHLLGAFLGVCLTHNYSIFTATSAYRHEPPPVSVRLSALTTAASFTVLALSGIPVVRALGVTVASMVLVALVVIELEHLRPLAKATSR